MPISRACAEKTIMTIAVRSHTSRRTRQLVAASAAVRHRSVYIATSRGTGSLKVHLPSPRSDPRSVNGIPALFILYSSSSARSLSTKDERRRVTVKRAAKGEIESGKRNRNPDAAEMSGARRFEDPAVGTVGISVGFFRSSFRKKWNT